MTVHLDPEMHRELRHLAVDLGTSAEAVIVAALTAELQKHRSSK
jgi:predicted transcriptional regulator